MRIKCRPGIFQFCTVLALVLAAPLLCRADDAPTVTADSVYRDAFAMLSAGRQADAERVLEEATATFEDDARLAFFAAACTRSRFNIESSAPLFIRVNKIAPQSRYASVAREILFLDIRRDVDAHFAALTTLAYQYSNDPLILWMAAVQCRNHNRNEMGIAYFEALAKHFDRGPALFHQTFANLLDMTGRYDEALSHREMAVKLEPATWSYSALGDTLTNLQRWADADVAYRKSLDMAETANGWSSWSWSMRKRGDHQGCVETSAKALALNPNSRAVLIRMADALAARNQPGDDVRAEEHYRRAIELAPRDMYPRTQLALLLGRRKAQEDAALANAPAPTTAPVASVEH
jgi:tetratricopeptide (TPR) repeat protein